MSTAALHNSNHLDATAADGEADIHQHDGRVWIPLHSGHVGSGVAKLIPLKERHRIDVMPARTIRR